MPGGFAGEAERLAEDVRADLRLSNLVALSPFALLESLDIPVLPLRQLAELTADPKLYQAVYYLQQEESSSLSALTVFDGSRRLVVFNDAHLPERINSDLCHEAAHGLLMHEPAPALGLGGCRTWDGTIESEAQFVAGTLLVPGKAARYAAKAEWSLDQVAKRFGCSVSMARWRDNVSGAKNIRRRRAH